MILERIKQGEVLVSNLYRKDGAGLTVGDNYTFNYEEYKVNEICEGELDGMVWIKKG